MDDAVLKETKKRLVVLKEDLLRVSKLAHEYSRDLKELRNDFDSLVKNMALPKRVKTLFLDLGTTFSLTLHAYHDLLVLIARRSDFLDAKQREVFAVLARCLETLSWLNDWHGSRGSVLTTLKEAKSSLNGLRRTLDMLRSNSHSLALSVKRLHNRISRADFNEEMSEIVRGMSPVLVLAGRAYTGFFGKVCFTAVYAGNEKWFDAQLGIMRRGLRPAIRLTEDIVRILE